MDKWSFFYLRRPGRRGVREGSLWISQGRRSIANDTYRLHDDDDDDGEELSVLL